MPLKRPVWKQGRIITLEHRSRVLADNPLGDPHVRPLSVWLPPGYDEGATGGRGRRFPVLFDLVGFMGSGPSHTNWRNFDENVPERASRLISQRRMGRCLFVFPDCFTAYGGNQYINSSAVGRYADYLVRELVPFVDREFRTLADRDHRGCFGKSSGGYGSIVHGMTHPETWGAVADHSGDAYFDFVYRFDWPNTLTELAKHALPKPAPGVVNVARAERKVKDGRDDGRVRRFLEAFWRNPKPSNAETHCLMNLCMAATYDPDPNAPNGFRLPFNLVTGEVIEARWKRWLSHDPIHLAARHRGELRSLNGIYIDCGSRDQYHIQYGSRILSKRLTSFGIRHRYEEFDDDHLGIDYRMEKSLPFLYRALRG